jgi:hypothetical protein
MAQFAVIKDGVVINTILAENKEVAESLTGETCVSYTVDNPAAIGYTYDGATFEQAPPLVDIVRAEDDIPTLEE